MASKKPPREPFETLYKRLEDTVARLEGGGLTIEESLALYEQGMDLAGRCQEVLQQAELRVTKLRDAFSDRLSAVREGPADYEPEPENELPFE